eukprot:1674922-Prymnesium_polylepis.1
MCIRDRLKRADALQPPVCAQRHRRAHRVGRSGRKRAASGGSQSSSALWQRVQQGRLLCEALALLGTLGASESWRGPSFGIPLSKKVE